jgi:hypothetical protein
LARPGLELAVALDPETRQFSALASLPVPAAKWGFLLHDSLQVSEVVAADAANGKRLEFASARGPQGYRLWSLRAERVGQRVSIRYGGQLPALESQRDHRGVLGGMPPMAAPEGSFLAAGSGWYPRPADLFTYRVELSVPPGQRALVAGGRIAETLPANARDGYRATFELTRPTDGIDLMAGPWAVRERTVARDGQPPLVLRTFFTPELDAVPGLAQGYLDDSAAYIARYSREIGAYPFSEFSVVASPLPTGFGMPTLTYLGADVLRLPFIRQTSLGHEILHNWWGNGVYVDYERGNWAEGLTTFMADYAYKEAESAAAAEAMRLAWLRDGAAVADETAASLREFRARTGIAGATLGYGQSAMLFQMLRDRIGPAAFSLGIREFWGAQQFKVASWRDLQAAFERASGQQLGAFFASWLDQRGMPNVGIDGAASAPVAGKHRLTLQFAGGKARPQLYLPLEISGDGRREMRWLTLPANATQAVLMLDFAPQRLRVDPEVRVWRRLPAEQLPPILRQWMAAGTPQLVNVAEADARAAVDRISGRFFERPAQLISGAALRQGLSGKAGILLAGTHAEVDRALAAAGQPARPASLAGRGTAQVWTLPAPALAVVSGQDAAALAAVQRALPHYGGQSWLVFEQGRVIDKGIWPAAVPEIAVAGERGPNRLR